MKAARNIQVPKPATVVSSAYHFEAVWLIATGLLRGKHITGRTPGGQRLDATTDGLAVDGHIVMDGDAFHVASTFVEMDLTGGDAAAEILRAGGIRMLRAEEDGSL